MDVALLDQTLTEPLHDREAPKTFAATLNARGSYHTEHFVLRLSPVVHRLIASVENGIHKSGSLSAETIQAFSTYLHETVHWWQHVGSTAGLLYSLAMPARSYAAFSDLKALTASIGAKKSIKTWAELVSIDGSGAEADLKLAHTIVNNALDLSFFSTLAATPMLRAEAASSRYFDSVAHTYRMAYAHTLGLLSQAVDPKFDVLPHPDRWDDEFRRLVAEKHPGFFHGGPVPGGKIGLHAIFEGQARFTQLQYLDNAADGSLRCADLRTKGFFKGIYVEAFDYFLEQAEASWPETIDDPLVGLFLLICDMAINPTRGIPVQIEAFERFIHDVDPAVRFGLLCRAARAAPWIKCAITEYSREEYERVSSALAEFTGYDEPLAALQEIDRWITYAPGSANLMAEKETFQFGEVNLPVRVVFAHFLAFSRDKLKRPEFFCWTGKWLGGTRISEAEQALFLEHSSLFGDKEDDDGVFPRLLPGKDSDAMEATFNAFYANIMVYDVIDQWILEDGPFVYNFSWVSQQYPVEEIAERVRYLFGNLFGFTPDEAELLVAPTEEYIDAAARSRA